jgi:hypothetical protein
MKVQDSVTKAPTPIPAPAEKLPFSSRPFAEPAAPEVTSAQPNALHYSLRTISLAVQPKLTIGQPNDKYEQEADRVAEKVVQQINAPQFSATGFNNPDPNTTEHGKPKLQLKPIFQRRSTIEGEATPDLESSINRARGGGQSLDPGLQEKMGRAMGADFSRVKVHTDAQSDQLNRSLQAKAFTTGQDVFFRQGAYEPGSRGGQELIAHELTHVVQQNSGTLQRREVDAGSAQKVMSSAEGTLRNSGIHSSSITDFGHSSNAEIVLQRELKDELVSGAKTLALVGESHNEIDTREEVLNWNEEGIDVKYENDTIEVEGDDGVRESVAPDEKPQRILFAWQKFRTPLFQDGWNGWESNYVRGTMIIDMSDLYAEYLETYRQSGYGREVCDLLHDTIKEVKDLCDTAEQAITDTRRPFRAVRSDEYMIDPLTRVQAIDKKIEALRANYFTGETGKQMRNEKGLCIARSRNMLRNAEILATKTSGLIYKIGNKHMEEIIDGSAVEGEISSRIALRERMAYKAEYQALVDEHSGYRGNG